MLKMGFHQLWVKLIMRFVTSVSFSILLNGECLSSFKPTRGIRQGILSLLICFCKQQRAFRAFENPDFSHQNLVDDSLLFFKANLESALVVKETLQQYCDASGQQINTDKSSIHFAKKCQQSVRDEIKGVFNVQNKCLSEKYLGIPSDVGSAANGAHQVRGSSNTHLIYVMF
jgi:hypothetical protein